MSKVEYKYYLLRKRWLARLMDAGKLLFGRISNKEKKGKWIKIEIKVYLHE